MESDLHVYPVDAKAVRQYLSHQQDSSLHSKQAKVRASHAMLKSQRKSRARNAVPRDRLRIVPSSQSQMLSDDVEALDGSQGVVHAEPLEDPTTQPENVYTVAGTSFPTNLNLVAPTQYAASSGSEAESPANTESEEAAPASDDSRGSSGRPCTGPVRHTDTDDCVAKKAMAQALQAERDVMSVDSNIDTTSKHISSVEQWEEDEHDTIKKDLTRKFHALDRLLRKQDRLLDTTDRRITNGDQIASSKIKLFKNDEIQHVESIINRAEKLESEVSRVLPLLSCGIITVGHNLCVAG